MNTVTFIPVIIVYFDVVYILIHSFTYLLFNVRYYNGF